MDEQSLPLPSLLSRLSRGEQIRLIMTHPFFTGKCPQCKQGFPLAKAALGKCKCAACGWSDQGASPASDRPEVDPESRSTFKHHPQPSLSGFIPHPVHAIDTP